MDSNWIVWRPGCSDALRVKISTDVPVLSGDSSTKWKSSDNYSNPKADFGLNADQLAAS
jgi:hypothetical protein